MTENDEAEQSAARIIGPSLAPDAAAPVSGIGPAMPDHLVRAQLAKGAEEDQQAEAAGAKIDPFEIGPLLPGSEIVEELRHMQPPTSKMTAALDEAISARDQQMSAIRETYNKTHKRDQSLLDAHRKKLAKKLRKEAKKQKKKHSKEKRREKKSAHHKKRKHKSSTSSSSSSSSSSPERGRDETKGPTRQPFDRDRDLLAPRVGLVAKRALIERSKQFSSKFAHGSQKFL